MASIKLGAIVVGIAGKIGGTVFRRGATGPTVSNTPNTGSGAKKLWGYINGNGGGGGDNNGNSTGQSGYIPFNWSGTPWPNRGSWPRLPGAWPPKRMRSVSSLWGTLTDDQRATWFAGAPSFPATNKFGVNYAPSAFNLFCAINNNRLTMGLDFILECPAPVVFPPIYDVHFYAVTSGLISMHLAEAVPAGFQIEIAATAPFSVGRQSGRGGYKSMQIITAGQVGFCYFSGAYIHTYGRIPLNQRINCKWRLINVATGIAGSWTYNKTKGVIASDITITANFTPTHGDPGDETVFAWTVRGSSVVKVVQGTDSVASGTSGTIISHPDVALTYTVYAWDDNGYFAQLTRTYTVDPL